MSDLFFKKQQYPGNRKHKLFMNSFDSKIRYVNAFTIEQSQLTRSQTRDNLVLK